MNDKQQLAAMGAHIAEQAEQAAQPLCMAKRIEELEAQVRVMAELLREAKPYMDHGNGAGVKGYIQISKKIDAALAGKLPAPAAPEGWQLVPVVPTTEMVEAYFAGKMEAQSCTHQQRAREMVARDYRAMLAAAPKPEAK